MNYLIDNFTLADGRTVMGVYSDDLLAGVPGVYPPQDPARVTDAINKIKFESLRSEINDSRDAEIGRGVELPEIGVFDTDATAQLRQTGALLLATLPIIRQMYAVVYKQCEAAGDNEAMAALNNARHEFQVPWVLKDNTTVTLGFDELKVIGPAVASAVASQVLDARSKKDAALQSLVSGSAFAAASDSDDSSEVPDDSSEVPDDSTPAAPASAPDATESDTAETVE